ncbi:MAG: hypothetical protein ACPGXK_09975 [Phycisphaerae bacterium]
MTIFGCHRPAESESDLCGPYVFFVDGAGGDELFTTWTNDVRHGFEGADFEGSGEHFEWQTGLGAPIDQIMSLEKKRAHGQRLARRIEAYSDACPGSPISILAHSAGTAVSVFGLELLPDDVQVDNVVFLGSSISNNYDLTEALERVSHRLYTFTSESDGVLRFLVPISGTADRRDGVIPAAGIRGFESPLNPDEVTKEQYRKLVHILWSREFRRQGNEGRHIDVFNPDFIRDYVVPLVRQHFEPAASGDCVDDERWVDNPDFLRWEAFPPDSWMFHRGKQEDSRGIHAVSVRETLAFRGDCRIFLERTFDPDVSTGDHCTRTRGFFEWERIPPEEHPSTHPNKIREELPFHVEGFVLKGATGVLEGGMGARVEVDDVFADWGGNPRAKVFGHSAVPGFIVSIELRAELDGEEVAYESQLVDYFINDRF